MLAFVGVPHAGRRRYSAARFKEYPIGASRDSLTGEIGPHSRPCRANALDVRAFRGFRGGAGAPSDGGI